jgi:hypothetical protein
MGVTLEGVHLLEVEPDLAAFLSIEDRRSAASVSVPVTVLPRGRLELDALLQDAGAFGAMVVDGMVLSRLTVAGRRALRLAGPGDVMALAGSSRTDALRVDREVATETRLAMFDDHLLVAIRRWPRLVTGLHVRLGEQQERLAAQLVICQMPRVEDRVLAMMWLLAETWGRVKSSGTSLPLMLTHGLLGEMIGARRSTVTLAVTHLVERGSVMRQDRGWLLLDRPRPVAEGGTPGGAPELVPEVHSGWDARVGDGAPAPVRGVALATIEALYEHHVLSTERFRDELAKAAASRDRSRALRRQIRERRLARGGRRAPS